MNQDLDTLLNTPLAALADDGFSSRVTARIARRARNMRTGTART